MLGAPRFLDEEMEERTKDPGRGHRPGLDAGRRRGAVHRGVADGGHGSLTLTGQLGDVMKESARAALSWLRTHAREYGIDPDFFKNAEMHVHVPSGAIPKDGPSAGVTMATAMASQLTGRPVRGDIAMTGEITLSGRVLPVGGIKEKVLAARRVGIREVILPKQNAKNVNEDLTPELRQDMTVHLVSTIDEVLALALQPVSSDVRPPTPGGKRQKDERKRDVKAGRTYAPAVPQHEVTVSSLTSRRSTGSVKVVYSPRYHIDIGLHVFPTANTVASRDAPHRGRRDRGRRCRRAGARDLGASLPSFTQRITSRSCATARCRPRTSPSSSCRGRAEMVDGFPRHGGRHHSGREDRVRLAMQVENSTALHRQDTCRCHIGGGLHHAFPNHGEGFCPFNDVAVAVRVLQARGLERVAIVDLDVHHGNGTAFIFESDAARLHLLDASAAQLPDVEAARLARHRPPRRRGRCRVSGASSNRRCQRVIAQRSAVRVLPGRRRSVRRRSARRTAPHARGSPQARPAGDRDRCAPPACPLVITLAGGYARSARGHRRDPRRDDRGSPRRGGPQAKPRRHGRTQRQIGWRYRPPLSSEPSFESGSLRPRS